MKPGRDRDAIYVEHMLECIARIEDYTGGDRQAFFGSTMIQDAVIRNLQTMAESSQQLSDTTRSSMPDVDWRAIAGFRNILVHDYLGVDPNVVWTVVEHDLPNLKVALMRLHDGLGGS